MNAGFERYPFQIISIAVKLAILFPGCSTLISDEFPEYDPLPVLNSILVAGQPLQAHVSFAEKIDTTYLEGFGGAEVYYSSDKTGMLQMVNLDSGRYYHNHEPQPGEIVTLQASLPGHDALYAVDTIPHQVTIEILNYTYHASYNEDGYFRDKITLSFSDDQNTQDYYELVLRRRDENNLRNLYSFNDNLDILLNEGIDPYSTPSLVFSDALFKDSVEIQLYFNSPGGSITHCYGMDTCYKIIREQTLIAELRHISKAYYTYKKQFYLYEKARNIQFNEGTAIAISNFSNVNNGMGIVGAYNSYIDSLVVPEDSVIID